SIPTVASPRWRVAGNQSRRLCSPGWPSGEARSGIEMVVTLAVDGYVPAAGIQQPHALARLDAANHPNRPAIGQQTRLFYFRQGEGQHIVVTAGQAALQGPLSPRPAHQRIGQRPPRLLANEP